MRIAKNQQLVYIRYRDHLLFRNSDPTLYQPSIRETVGWILGENEHAVYLLWDRSVNPQRHERSSPEESGMIILKSDILEVKKIA